MKLATAIVTLAAAASLVACATAAMAPMCTGGYNCGYRYISPDGSHGYTFDFSSLCNGTDLELYDTNKHRYYANICGTSQHHCNPGKVHPILCSMANDGGGN